ncbi:MAG: DUF456 domain-containing protein [Patescibacteria group bacterium]
MLGEITLILVVIALLLVGLAGIFLPFLPGVPLAWLGIFIYAYAKDFTSISLKTVLIFLGLTAFTLVVDFAAPMIGAKKYHASKFGVLGSSIGLLIGLIVLGPIGIIAGPFLGALLGELAAGRKSQEAIHSAKGALIGFLAGSLIKMIIVLVMIGFFIAALF